MPSVAELSGPYENFMLGPRRGPDVCVVLFNFTRGYERCYACSENEDRLAVVAPISYSVGLEQLHRALMGYKRLRGEVARRLTVELAAVLWRFLLKHERCVARAAGVPAFELVATVPSGDRRRDSAHPLRRIVGDLVGPTRQRHQRLLRRSTLEVEPRTFEVGKFEAVRAVDGKPVLLIDDTWTTGASAQSAAAALRRAGAGPVAVVVIGRHLNREWHENDKRLRAIAKPFDWERCALCPTSGS
jgi:predicted phosphoribosyltransferase